MHLEMVYGPGAKGIKKGQSWRSGNNPKEGNRKRKSWSERAELYAFIRKSPQDAEKRLTAYIQEHFGSQHHGLNASSPGAHLLRQAWMLMKRTAEGAAARTEVAKKRAAIRKANKAASTKKKKNDLETAELEATET